MSKLFEGKSFAETLDQIEKYRKEGLEEIHKGSPSCLADISDAFDYWIPWMLKQLRGMATQGLTEKRLRDEVRDILERPVATLMERTNIHTMSQFSEHDRFGAADTVRSRLEKALALPKTQAEKEPQEKSQGLCDTTQTERFSNPDCRCKTYEGNLGPCRTFDTAGNGRCAYCDHEIICHPAQAGKGRG